MTSATAPEHDIVESYYTNMEQPRAVFRETVRHTTLTKRILIFHGVGGVGKSSLLRMCRLYCQQLNIPTALASGDYINSPLDILVRWADDLTKEGVALKEFTKVAKKHQAIQAKVAQQARRIEDRQRKLGNVAGKVFVKSVEAVTSLIPIIGPLASVAGGMSSEALVEWFRGFLNESEIDLVLDTTKQLTEPFLVDIANFAVKRRLVLMLDTYEKLPLLESWICNFTEKLNPNVLMVIAGRNIPNWDRQWHGWLAKASVQAIESLTSEHMQILAKKYYSLIAGVEPDSATIEEIVNFARGLPIAVTAAVDLAVKHEAKNFRSVKSEVIEDLALRLSEDVPSTLKQALYAAAAVRWFDEPLLRAMLEKDDVSELYDELKKLPFRILRDGRFALHDTVRNTLDANLKVRDRDKHRFLHQRAAEYFERQPANIYSEVGEQVNLERLYHAVCVDEDSGIKLFSLLAEDLLRARLINNLRSLLNDANTYPLENENSRLWRQYYDARLRHETGQYEEAEKTYLSIANNEKAESRLRAYCYADVAQLWVRTERLRQPDGVNKAIDVIERSQALAPPHDSKALLAYSNLRGVYNFSGGLEKFTNTLEQKYLSLPPTENPYTKIQLLWTLKDTNGVMGKWASSHHVHNEALQILSGLAKNDYIHARIVGEAPWCFLFGGRYSEAESHLREAVDFCHRSGDEANILPGKLRDLGLALGLQGKYHQALGYFNESTQKYTLRGSEWIGGTGVAPGFLGLLAIKQKDLDLAEKSLLQSLDLKTQLQDRIGIPEILVWLGELYEARAKYAEKSRSTSFLLQAEKYYLQCLQDYRILERHHFEAGALTGLARIQVLLNKDDGLSDLIRQAMDLSEQFEYNDHFASLMLTQGHDAWTEGKMGTEKGFEAAFRFYSRALVYALRFNRFLLDEVLADTERGSPLRPIIPYCLERGDEGQKMLEFLRYWWGEESNRVETKREFTISPIADGLSLLEAEAFARKLEKGDGQPQISVIERIDRALHRG